MIEPECLPCFPLVPLHHYKVLLQLAGHLIGFAEQRAARPAMQKKQDRFGIVFPFYPDVLFDPANGNDLTGIDRFLAKRPLAHQDEE